MTLWNEEIRRCGVVDNAEKVSRAKQSLGYPNIYKETKESQLETSWNEESEDVGW